MESIFMADARTNELIAAVDNLLASWRTWRDDAQIRDMTDELTDSITGCLVLWDSGTVPGDLRRLLPILTELKEQWNLWVAKHDAAPIQHPIPGRGFWSVLEQIELAQVSVKKPKQFTIEPIAKLDAMQPAPSDGQICRMYGFTSDGTPSGDPILSMLQEERANPGHHTGPGTGWMPPHARRQQAAEAKQQEAIERMQRAARSKVAAVTEPAKETVDQLIELGVCGKQICKMKKFTKADLAAYCQEHRLTEPQWEPTDANTVKGDFDRELPEHVPMSGPGDTAPATPTDIDRTLTIEQQIIQQHQAGFTPSDIADLLTEADVIVTAQKVGKVIARWRADPTAFNTADVA
jgi:hypothetical protein